MFSVGIYGQSFPENARTQHDENVQFRVIFTKTHVYKFQHRCAAKAENFAESSILRNFSNLYCEKPVVTLANDYEPWLLSRGGCSPLRNCSREAAVATSFLKQEEKNTYQAISAKNYENHTQCSGSEAAIYNSRSDLFEEKISKSLTFLKLKFQP